FGAIRDIVQTFEGVGFDGISCNDHVVGGHPDRAGGEKVHTIETAVHEPFVLLSFIGAVTTRLELATAILLLPQRQTVLAAKQAAEITGSRAMPHAEPPAAPPAAAAETAARAIPSLPSLGQRAMQRKD
ncbi:MAG TPA: LLM class flavin-dependent oxidoreductase, partial [Pseudomonadota bacterium]|nr:LLM class flavin-dependent oxidoreductase [Pseudomonadota bacterium]